jgi:hypothetical protein
VAFGDEGARLARRAARESNEPSLAVFGSQEDKGATHAALIMKIGDWTIVDWSHSAKCNFWRRDDKRIPELYQSRYPAGTLYSAPLKHAHPSPGTFSWQRTFASVIEGSSIYFDRESWIPDFG